MVPFCGIYTLENCITEGMKPYRHCGSSFLQNSIREQYGTAPSLWCLHTLHITPERAWYHTITFVTTPSKTVSQPIVHAHSKIFNTGCIRLERKWDETFYNNDEGWNYTSMMAASFEHYQPCHFRAFKHWSDKYFLHWRKYHLSNTQTGVSQKHCLPLWPGNPPPQMVSPDNIPLNFPGRIPPPTFPGQLTPK